MELNDATLVCLGAIGLGGLLVWLGLRQRRRAIFERVPLTSWHFKLFFGGALLIIALNVLFHLVTGR